MHHKVCGMKFMHCAAPQPFGSRSHSHALPSPDGKTKYFQSGNYTAKIMVPDYGKPLVPVGRSA